MKRQNDVRSVEERVDYLERRLRLFRLLGAVGSICFLVAVCSELRLRPAHADDSGQVLRVRGLIVEDAQGKPRILLGAPVPKVTGRKRQDDGIGMIILNENGADRVVLAAPVPDPQANGKVVRRASPHAGLTFDDAEGNERGGIGIPDGGRGVVCLDYPAPLIREGVCLGVIPDQGFTGLMINAESGSESDRATMVVLKDGTSLIKLADTNGIERTRLMVQGDNPAQLLILDPKTKSKVDMFEKVKP